MCTMDLCFYFFDSIESLLVVTTSFFPSSFSSLSSFCGNSEKLACRDAWEADLQIGSIVFLVGFTYQLVSHYKTNLFL